MVKISKSNTLDFIQIYIATNTENHNLRKTEFKVKLYLEAGSQDCVTKSYMYIHKGNIYMWVIPCVIYTPKFFFEKNIFCRVLCSKLVDTYFFFSI